MKAFYGALRYEFRMKISRRSLWIAFILLGLLFTQFHQPWFRPLTSPASEAITYWMGIAQSFLAVAIGIFLADRLPRDRRLKVDELFNSLPGGMGARLVGKYLGTTFATLIPMFAVYSVGAGYILYRWHTLAALPLAEVGKLTLCCEPTDMGALSQRIVDTVAPLIWRTNKIELVADVPSEPAIALVDALRLEQALQNLLHNAVCHTSPGGIIAFAVWMQEQGVVLQVRDTGEGIAPEDLPRIWQRFYQESTVHTEMRGFGSCAGQRTDRRNGRNSCGREHIGRGGCFTLHLPCVV